MPPGALFGKDTNIWGLEIPKGQIPGHTLVNCSFRAIGVQSTEQTVIPLTTPIRVARPDDPIDLFIASTNALDTFKAIFIIYLDIDFREKFAVVPLDGSNAQTAVLAIRDLRRINLAGVFGDKSLGDIYFSQNGNFTSGIPTILTDTMTFINKDDGKTYSGLLTVPKERTLFGKRYTHTCGTDINCQLEVGVRINVKGFLDDFRGWRHFVRDNGLTFDFEFFSWPQGTDVELTVSSPNPPSNIDTIFVGYFIDNDLLGPDILLNQIIPAPLGTTQLDQRLIF